MGTVRLVKGIIRIEGIAGLFQGCAPAVRSNHGGFILRSHLTATEPLTSSWLSSPSSQVVGSSVSWGGYFYLYEGFKRQLVDFKLGTSSGVAQRNPSEVLNSADNFLLACGAGGLMVLITNPIWLIKTRMQLQMKKASAKHNIKPYSGLFDAGRSIVRDEGFWALYRGCGPALLLTSHGGIQFVVYEFLRKHFHYHRIERSKDGNWSNLNVWGRLELSSGYLMMGAAAKMCVQYN